MGKWRDFNPGVPLPSTWTDGIEEVLNNYTSGNFRLRRMSNTVLRIPAGPGDGQVGTFIDAKPRWITADADATCPGGAPTTFDVYLCAYDDSFSFSSGEVDDTNHAFTLKISSSAPSGSGGEALYRQIAQVVWDGTKITDIYPTAIWVPPSRSIQLDALAGSALNAFLGLDDQSVPRKLKVILDQNSPVPLGNVLPSTCEFNKAHGLGGITPLFCWAQSRSSAVQEAGPRPAPVSISCSSWDATNVHLVCGVGGTSNNGFHYDLFIVY